MGSAIPLAGLHKLKHLSLESNHPSLPMRGKEAIASLLAGGCQITANGFIFEDGTSFYSLTQAKTAQEKTPPKQTVSEKTPATSYQTFDIGDAGLEACLRQRLKKTVGEPIMVGELAAIQTLDASGQKISNISALKHCPNLVSLFLNNNQISDLSPLSGLTKLRDLRVMHNQISNLEPLRGLSGLTRLYVEYNRIKDITPLMDLKALTDVYLRDNPIEGVRALSRWFTPTANSKVVEALRKRGCTVHLVL